MKHNMRLKKEPFRKISAGEKTFELRLLDEKRQLIQIGDEIEFTSLGDGLKTVSVRVKALHKFSTFAELYQALPLEKCGYDSNTIHEASPSDMDEYYSIDEQNKYGVVGIEFIKE